MTRVRLIDASLVLLAFCWLLLFAHQGLWAPFSGDDLMNLHGYLTRSPASLLSDNLRYWSTAYRPLGGLFYVGLYRVFGFNPLPFRVACFALLALNLALLWRFTLRLSGSRETAFLALLLAAYHAWFVDLYYSTGSVYELLCYAFYLGAFNYYLGVRERKLAFSSRQMATLGALYLCALNAKEMAATLPLLLASYELIYYRSWREYRGVLLTALLTVPYIVGKLTGAGSLVNVPSYHMTISPGRYLDAFHLYLNPLLYQEHVFRDPNTIQLVGAMLAFALWRRSRPLLFAWTFLLLTLLPVAFIAHYAGFFLYLPMAGWSLYGAELLVTLRRMLPLKKVTVVALPIALALFLGPRHRRETAKTLGYFKAAQPPTRQIAAELLALRPTLPHGAHLMFLGDPMPQNEYYLLFLSRLLYHDMTITIENPPHPGHYDAVFTYRDGHLAATPG